MSNPAANPQPEPTMEEILASIRKIISEDQPEAQKPAPQPAPLQAVEPAPVPAEAADTEVLELTDEVPAEETPAPPPPPEENDIAFASEPVPELPATPPAAEIDLAEAEDLISDSTRSAVDDAFATRNQGQGLAAPFAAGTLDALFVQAVQGAFQPTLKEWIDANRAEIMNTMKPLIRTWMDEHLPQLIEAAIAKELERAAGESRKR